MNQATLIQALEIFYPLLAQGYLNIFTQAKRNHFYRITDDPRALAHMILSLNRRGNIWFSPGLRKAALDGNKRGTETEIVYSPGVYIDIDIKNDKAHKDGRLPESMAEALRLIEAAPVQPSLIVNSGYGLQAWWLFSEGGLIESTVTLNRMKNAHKAVNEWFYAKGEERGWKLDKMVPLVGLARLPGTDNVKIAGEPREVAIVAQNENRHCLQVLIDEFMPALNSLHPLPHPHPLNLNSNHMDRMAREREINSDFPDSSTGCEYYGGVDEREKLRQALRAIPDEHSDHYQTWINIGMALKNASESNLDLWEEFSRRSPKFKDGECERTWSTLQPHGAITAATIFHLADKNDAGWRTKLNPARVFHPPIDLFDFEPDPWEKYCGAETGFPDQVFPPAMRDMVNAVVETFHVPPIMAAATQIGVASVAMGKNYRLTIKEGHQQWGNLYVMLAVHPGVGKSPVLRPFQEPLVDKVNEDMPQYERALAEYRSTLKGLKAQQAGVEEKIRQASKKAPDLIEQLMTELHLLESSMPTLPTEPCFFINDATSEAMARRMSANDGFIGVLSSEGRRVLEIARGKYTGTGSDVSLWLAGHGYDYYRQDRVNKASFVIESPCIAALIMTQPDSLKDLGKNVSLRESGFLARWLYIVPDTTPQRYADEAIPFEIQNAYRRCLERIIKAPMKREYRFTPEAYEIWKTCHDTFKLRALEDTYKANSFLASWMSKLPENIARLALLLSVCWDPDEELIRPQFAKWAAEIAEILFRHTIQTNNIMCLDDGSNLAYTVWNWIDTNRDRLKRARASDRLDCNLEVVKINDLCVFRVANLTKNDEARNVLEQLHERGWLRRAMIQCTEGRRPMEGYVVRPRNKMPVREEAA